MEALYICAVGLDILKFEKKHHCFIVLHISIGGAWSFVSEELSPPKPPLRGDGTVWQNFSLLFNAIDSDKYPT